jgi:hypothetical protein
MTETERNFLEPFHESAEPRATPAKKAVLEDKPSGSEPQSVRVPLAQTTSSSTISSRFSDDCVVNAQELAAAMRVSRWTVQRWCREGYRFEFGRRTTPGHCNEWLRTRAKELRADDNILNKLAVLD